MARSKAGRDARDSGGLEAGPAAHAQRLAAQESANPDPGAAAQAGPDSDPEADLLTLETRAQLSLGLVRSMVDSWLPTTYADTASTSAAPQSTDLYASPLGGKQAFQKRALQRAILGRGNARAREAAASAAADAGASRADIANSGPSRRGSAGKDGDESAAESKLASRSGGRVAKPRPVDPLSLYLNKKKRK